jgi:hypothetical protein
MKIDERLFENILRDLIDDNPIACGGVLSVFRVAFTDQVPTLSVSLEKRPTLMVNLEFLRKHTKSETHVKSCLLHEFLHVLLGHTERFASMTPELNLALDAVINHIILRSCGDEYAEFFRLYYKQARDYAELLAPFAKTEVPYWINRSRAGHTALSRLRLGLYQGKLLADDILDIVKQAGSSDVALPRGRYFLGGHNPLPARSDLPDEMQEALARTLKVMDGSGIFRAPGDRGVGPPPYTAAFTGKSKRILAWERAAYAVLRASVTPDARSSAIEDVERVSSYPVLNAADRRGFLRSLWSPLIPEVQWQFIEHKPMGTCQVYLDVSGSMNQEMAALVNLMTALKRYIKTPFWAFSTEVSPAVIEKGVLKAGTTGGTAMNCVLAHVLETRPDKAVVITDGYIEQCNRELLERMGETKQALSAIVSRDGTTRVLDQAGIPSTQLPPYPEDRT